jgi:hypothetical protein
MRSRFRLAALPRSEIVPAACALVIARSGLLCSGRG